MKRLFILLITTTMLLAITEVSAQKRAAETDDDAYKGWWIGGELGFWHSDIEGLSTNSFFLAPEAGYDFNKRWGLGVAIGYGLVSVERESANIFVLNPYARWKYYNPGRVSLFLDGGIGVAGGDMDGFRIGIHPGIAVKVNKHIRFQAHLGFLGYATNYFNDNIDGSRGFGFRFSSSDLKLGFYYTF